MSRKIPNTAENWENGSLGLNPSAARVVLKQEAAAVEQAIGLNMHAISIRLPQDLIGTLKEIAAYRGVGYQPMVRDLLQRWAAEELKSMLAERLEDAKRRADEYAGPAVVSRDLERTA